MRKPLLLCAWLAGAALCVAGLFLLTEGLRIAQPLRADQMQAVGRNAYSQALGPLWRVLEAASDDMDAPRRSEARLLEDGRALGPAHSLHDTIRDQGGGAYSHWQKWIVFSASDGSDPRHNGRAYELVARYGVMEPYGRWARIAVGVLAALLAVPFLPALGRWTLRACRAALAALPRLGRAAVTKAGLRTMLATAGLGALAVLAGIGLFELVDDQRYYTPRLHVLEAETDPPLVYGSRWRFSPFTERVQVMRADAGRLELAREVRVARALDQCGMRSKEPVRVFRPGPGIALIGDSFTEGMESDYDDALQARLEARFADRNVFNFGQSGSNSADFARMARSFMRCLDRPLEAAVVGLFMDPWVGDIPRQLAIERFGKRVILDGATVTRRTYDEATRSLWRRLLFNLEFEARRYSATYNRLVPAKSAADFSIPIVEALDDAARRSGWIDRIIANLRAFAQATGLPPSRILVWYVPSAHELTEIWSASRQHRAPAAHVAKARALSARIAARLSEEGFTVVDPTPRIDQSFLSGGPYPFTGSGHFRPEGYAIVADAVAPALARILTARPDSRVSQRPGPAPEPED